MSQTKSILIKTELRPRFLNLHFAVQLVIGFCKWNAYNKSVGQKLVDSPEATRLKTAKFIIFKEVQKSSFPDEYAAVQFDKPITKDSILGKLCVYMDDGIVKVKNRARYATSLCGRQLDFIVLPGGHQVTRLFVHNYHIAYHHLNHETVLNEIRQIYFIPKLSVIQDCT